MSSSPARASRFVSDRESRLVNVVGIVASVLLGVAFLLAGATKVAAGPAWTAMATDLGAPAFTIPVVPWVELAVGAALIVQLRVPIPAFLALALLAAFSVLMLVRIRQGRRPACACFGAWSASPIGARHLSRNAVLAALAVLAMWA